MFDIDDPAHHRWLATHATELVDFYRPAADPGGGFGWLDDRGRLTPTEPTHLWITARMVHCFALARLLGMPGAAALAGHGLSALAGCLQDPVHGGWFGSVRGGVPVGDGKSAYDHALVLLAAASAAQAGLPGAGDLLARADEVIERRFWRADDGLCADGYGRDWRHDDGYRCANTNMHLADAYLAVAQATGEDRYARRAERIAARIIGEFTAANDWRLPVHFDVRWRPLLDYHADLRSSYVRPYGSSVGHWLEWVRILLQLPGDTWVAAAVRLFERAVTDGWDAERGGFVYTVDWSGRPVLTDRMHWPVTEAIGAAAALYRVTGEERYAGWYKTFWRYAWQRLVDHEHGSWYHQLDRDNRRVLVPWHGKPDLYHTLHATLFARVPPGTGIAAAAATLRPGAIRG